jgi:NAD(P)H-hydrate epimerase
VLTPHPGEFARLLGEKRISSDERLTLARQFASELNIVLVLKGHRTLIADGHRFVENTTGNPGMATGGTGDVLTGVITGLLCQGLSPFDAAHLGAHVHGLAGDLGAHWQGQTGLIAHDLIRFLPEAFRLIEEANRNELVDSSTLGAPSEANSQQ